MPLDPPFDNRFALHSTDPESIRHWANRIPGVGKWNEVAKTVGFSSPWSDYAAGFMAARFRREFADIVRIEGLVKTSSNITPLSNIFTLPPGFRPAEALIFATEGAVSTDMWARIHVLATGGVQFVAIGGTTGGILTPPYTVAFLSINCTFSISTTRQG